MSVWGKQLAAAMLLAKSPSSRERSATLAGVRRSYRAGVGWFLGGGVDAVWPLIGARLQLTKPDQLGAVRAQVL